MQCPSLLHVPCAPRVATGLRPDRPRSLVGVQRVQLDCSAARQARPRQPAVVSVWLGSSAPRAPSCVQRAPLVSPASLVLAPAHRALRDLPLQAAGCVQPGSTVRAQAPQPHALRVPGASTTRCQVDPVSCVLRASSVQGVPQPAPGAQPSRPASLAPLRVPCPRPVRAGTVTVTGTGCALGGTPGSRTTRC